MFSIMFYLSHCDFIRDHNLLTEDSPEISDLFVVYYIFFGGKDYCCPSMKKIGYFNPH